MAQTASDVRAGGAFYESSLKDDLTPALAGLKGRVEAWGRVMAALNPGAGGIGFLNRLVFGAKDVDARTGEYVGRVGGLIAPLRALLSPGPGGAGLVNRLVFGDLRTDAAGEYLGRTGGLVAPLRALFSPGPDGAGLVNRLVFGRKLDIMGAYVGRVGGVKGVLAGMFGAGAAGTGLVNRWLFGENRADASGQLTARVGGLVPLARSAASAVVGAFRSAEAGARSLASSIGRVGLNLAALGGAAASPLAGLFKGSLDRAAELAKLSRQYGLPVAALNRLKYAADAAGVSLDEVGQDRTGRYADLIAKAPEINPDDARAAAEAQLALADATRALQDALLPLVQIVGPLAKEFAGWVKQNAGLVAVALPAAAAVTALGVAFAGASAAVVGLAAVAGKVWAIGSAVVGAVLSPVGLAVAAVAGLTYAFVRFTDTGRGLFRSLADTIGGELAPAFATARGAFGAFTAAVQKGDLNQALEVAAAGLELLWAGTVAWFEREWAGFKSDWVDGWHEITGGMAGPLKAAWQGVKDALNDAWQAVKAVAAKIESAWDDLWAGVREPVLRVLAFLAPIGALIAAPFVAGVALVKAVWDDLDRSLFVNLVNFGAALEKVWLRVAGTLKNTFIDVATAALDAVRRAAEALKGLDFTGQLAGPLDAGIQAAADAKKALPAKEDIDRRVSVVDTMKKIAIEAHANEQRESQQQRRAERGDDVTAAESAVEAARKRLDAATAAANAPRPPAAPEQLTALKDGLLGGVSVRGGFGGAALGQQFGFGSETNKQTEFMRQLVTGQGQLPENIARHLAPLVRPGVIR